MQQYKEKYFKDFITSLKTFIILWCAGPALFTLSMLLGADPWDGAIGTQATNPFFQDFLMTSGAFISLAATIVGVLLSLWLAVSRYNLDKRYLLIPIIALIAPLGLLFAMFVLGGTILYN